jgi:hypothetical protein
MMRVSYSFFLFLFLFFYETGAGGSWLAGGSFLHNPSFYFFSCSSFSYLS